MSIPNKDLVELIEAIKGFEQLLEEAKPLFKK
ncbi:hypothetical protein RERY_39690 [Rhodococcus erythropolis]|nr:hypothetical protein RERY_39690 [Rhodococcus erythropolis]